MNAPVLKAVARSSRQAAPFAYLLYFLVLHLPAFFSGPRSRCASQMSGGYHIYSLDFSC